MNSVLEFDAVNTAVGSENKIHEASTATRYGVPSAAVPATALLPFHLAAAAAVCGFGERPAASASLRFLDPIAEREHVRVVRRTGDASCRLDLIDPLDRVKATGAFSPGDAHYGRRRESFNPAATRPRPLTTEGLMADERLDALTVDCSDDAVSAYLDEVGLVGGGAGALVAFLVSQFVPFLRHNFTREHPSLYVGVDLLIVAPPSAGATLTMQGRIDRLFKRNGRSFAVFETAWFDRLDHGQLWARHTLVYDLGEPAAR